MKLNKAQLELGSLWIVWRDLWLDRWCFVVGYGHRTFVEIPRDVRQD